MLFLYCCEHLANLAIEFTVHYVGGKENPGPIITVKGQLNNEQLVVLTQLGAAMGPEATFMIITKLSEKDS